MLDKDILKEILNDSLSTASKFINKEPFNKDNKLKSAKFVSIFGELIFNKFFKSSDNVLNMVKVDNSGYKQHGEWLLDITITQDSKGFKKNIILAVESESDSSEKAFNDDFAKLIHIKAINYIYLNGVNQKTPKGLENYISKRLLYAENILNFSNYSSFYLGFWPSPKKISKIDSIWLAFPNDIYSHLNKIFLYKLINGKFEKV